MASWRPRSISIRAGMCASTATVLIGCDGGRRWCAKRSARRSPVTTVIGSACSRPTSALAELLEPVEASAAPGRCSRSIRGAAAMSTRSTARSAGWCTTTSARRGGFRCSRPRLGDPADPRRRRRTFATRFSSKEDWFGRRLVADRFRDRRVFICGDAAHIWVPYGRLRHERRHRRCRRTWPGCWPLASTAGRRRAFSTPTKRERLPITEQVSHFAMSHALALQAAARAVPTDIEERRARRRCRASGLGARVVRTERAAVLLRPAQFRLLLRPTRRSSRTTTKRPRPTRWRSSRRRPCRAAARRTCGLRDGRSLYDAAATSGYVLLRFDPAVDARPLLDAARRRGMPLQLLDVDAPDASSIYRHALVMSRPDQHVAWRGQAAPADALHLIDRLRGAFAES